MEGFMFNYDLLIQCANRLGCRFLKDEPMYKHTTFKIGGCADLFIYVETMAQLQALLKVINTNKIPFFVLGNGSNILVPDNGIRGCIIKLTGDFTKIKLLDDTTIECGAGATLAKLCMVALENSLSGLEFAWGIPGCVGGAAFMNAGAYGGEMGDVLESCSHVTANGAIGKIDKEHLNLSYRKSAYTYNDNIITSIIVKLKKGEQTTIREYMDDFMARRKSKQPIEMPSAGSVFKRPEGNFAGTLIEQCGLKGEHIGGAMVSDKHAGFIVNTGNATCSDVVRLISLIQDRVKENTGVELECEVKVIDI